MRELVLIGAGHAHVQVLRGFCMRPPAGVQVTLVVDRPEAVYSGMVPGFVAGDYRAHELEIDAIPLARRARARTILAAATGIDPDARRVLLDGRAPIAYDAASFDVGSTVRGLDAPGVREHALATRPIRDFVDGLETRVAAARARDAERLRVAVVGGGAAGVELAFTLEARLRAEGARPEVAVLTDVGEILPGASATLVRTLRREAERRGIALRRGVRVAAVEREGLRLASGEEVACDLAVWATGAAPPPWLAAAGLPADEAGFLRVRETLQLEGRPELFAAGDVATLAGHPWVPKAGVYAVRQGPVLAANLRAFLTGGRLRRYRPQRDFLALLNLGDARAAGGKWGLALAGRGVWRLKDAIDRRFMRRFQVLDDDGEPAPDFPGAQAMGGEPMACGGCAAKLAPDPLARALGRLAPLPRDASVVLGLEAPDDAAAFRTAAGDLVLASVDGFRAFADDPWLVGKVAAVNALSDVYAKGGRPRHALALVTVPEAGSGAAEETLFQVLSGVRAALDQTGVSLVGGHSTTGPELFVALSVTGDLDSADAPLPLAGLRPGDRLILTKPLGTGVVLAADMQGRAKGAWVRACHASMLRTNAASARVARAAGAGACTDVSGFGLAGHLLEMLRASGVAARVELAALPRLPGARRLLEAGLRSTSHGQNAALAREVELPAALAGGPEAALLFDPQTSGGLLFGISGERAETTLRALASAPVEGAAAIGVVEEAAAGPRLRAR